MVCNFRYGDEGRSRWEGDSLTMPANNKIAQSLVAQTSKHYLTFFVGLEPESGFAEGSLLCVPLEVAVKGQPELYFPEGWTGLEDQLPRWRSTWLLAGGLLSRGCLCVAP